MVEAATTQDSASGKKSGIKAYEQGEVLFNDNDVAESLFIIQRGQLRLFKPKGRGFIELAILRAGEVIGEMAYFDEKARKRSCSAAAIVRTEVVEISFKAFEKTMSGLNPWFKTIINTLAERLRKTNDKVRELESNSVGYATGGKIADYKFLNSPDVVKILSVYYLVLCTFGKTKDGTTTMHMSKLKFYGTDVFNIQEVKLEEFTQLLKNEHFLQIGMDEDNLPRVIQVRNVDLFKGLLMFFNNQRTLKDEKKLVISHKCERFLKRIMDQIGKSKVKPDKNGELQADITKILKDFKGRNVPISEDDLQDAQDANFVGELVVGAGNVVTAPVSYLSLKKAFPAIQLMNAISRLNESKNNAQKGGRY